VRRVVPFILAGLLLVACGGDGGSATTAPTTTLVLSGEELFETFFVEAGKACNSCHRLDDQDGAFAPTLGGVSSRAGDRVEGMSAEEYLRQSIIDPEAYKVEGWDQPMPTNFGEILSEAEINSLIEFLLTQ
jgi:mono/diheme cytochrome c family protein